MNIGDECTTDVIALSPTGEGIAKHEGKVIFLPLSLPGQQARIQIKKKKKRCFFGEVQKVLKKSPYEIPAKDNSYPAVGGALLQTLSYEEQLRWKKQFVIDAFERIGKMENITLEDIVGSPQKYEYRNKMEFSFGYEEMRTETLESGKKIHHDNSPGLGLHRKGNWREIVRLTDFCLCDQDFFTLRNLVENFALESDLPVWNPIQSKGFWRNLIIRKSQKTEEILVEFLIAQKKKKEFWTPLLENMKQALPSLVGVLETIHDGVSVVSQDAPTEVLWGKDSYEEELAEKTFSVSHNAFFQINTPATEKLIKTLSSLLIKKKGVLLDLFCGAGTLGICLAEKNQKLIGIEIIQKAIADAKNNAAKNHLTETHFLAGDVGALLPDVLKNNKIDTVLVDPPRAGLSRKARKLLKHLPAQQLLMVSCNPATLARDLLDICEGGWKVEKIIPHDLFPNTPHVETVASLRRV